MRLRPLVTACVLAAGLAAGARATTYDEALRAYWREDHAAAAQMMLEVMSRGTNAVEVERATYVLGLLMDRMKTNETAALRSTLSSTAPAFEAYVSGHEALRRGAYADAFTQLARFAVEAPSDGLRLLGLRALCQNRWERTEVGRDRFLLLNLLEIAQRLDFRECPESFRAMADTLAELARGERDFALEGKVSRFQFACWPSQGTGFTAVRALLRAGLDQEAAAFMEEVFRTLPEDQWPDVYAQMASAYRQAKRPEDAMALLERGLAVVGTNHCRMVMAVAAEHGMQGRWDRALNMLESVTGRCDRAVRRLEELLRAFPEKHVQVWAIPASGIENIALQADGKLYALAREPWKIVELDTSNGATRAEILIREQGSLGNGFHAFAVYADGSFLVQNRRIGRDGETVERLNVSAHMHQAAVAPDGRVIVPSRAEGNALVLGPGGDARALFTSAIGERSRVIAALIDGKRIILARETRLDVHDESSRLTATIGKAGNGPAEFNGIRDVAIDREGLIYVAESRNGRIQILDGNGRFLTQFRAGGPCECLEVDADGAIYVSNSSQLIKYAPRDGGARALVKGK